VVLRELYESLIQERTAIILIPFAESVAGSAEGVCARLPAVNMIKDGELFSRRVSEGFKVCMACLWD
jgi:hypothetical protein